MDENGTVVEPVTPPVVVPQVISVAQAVDGFPNTWSEQDYSNGAFVSGLVYNPWRTNETWSSMPDWLSNLKWMETDTHSYFYSADQLDFTFASGTIDMYLVSTNSNLPWLLDMSGLEPVSTDGTPVTSTYNGMTFYVFKRTVQAGSEIKLWLMMNRISGIAFDTSNVILAP